METTDNLKKQLAIIAAELERTRSELRTLQKQSRKTSWARKTSYSVILLGAVLAFGSIFSPQSSALNSPAQRPVHRLEAPVLIVGAGNNTIAEISEDPGRYGITVYGKKGGKIALGTSSLTDGGLIQLSDPGQKAIANVSERAVMFSNTNGEPAAGIGLKPSGSGFLALGNPNGDGVVEAGMLDDGRGVVRVYPLGGPASFIMGGKPK